MDRVNVQTLKKKKRVPLICSQIALAWMGQLTPTCVFRCIASTEHSESAELLSFSKEEEQKE